MNLWPVLEHYLFLYWGVDWIITLTVLVSIFLLGEKSRAGFLAGMISSAFGVLFSFQISSIANGLTSAILLGLYARGYMKWGKKDAESDKGRSQDGRIF